MGAKARPRCLQFMTGVGGGMAGFAHCVLLLAVAVGDFLGGLGALGLRGIFSGVATGGSTYKKGREAKCKVRIEKGKATAAADWPDCLGRFFA